MARAHSVLVENETDMRILPACKVQSTTRRTLQPDRDGLSTLSSSTIFELNVMHLLSPPGIITSRWHLLPTVYNHRLERDILPIRA